MNQTVNDGGRQVFAMIVLGIIFAMALTVLKISSGFQNEADRQFRKEQLLDHTGDFTAMSVYGDAVPMPTVIAALDMYGYPETLCLQMEDLKNEMGGTPYPMAKYGDTKMDVLIEKLREYSGKQVYVYTATPNGLLQLCISELPHSENPDGDNQDWSD